jgi:small subunit ribosomal protein S19
MKKELYHGLTEEQLKVLPYDEFVAKHANSRERRTLKRIATNVELKKLVDKVRTAKGAAKKMIKTHVREAVILPEWLGLTFGVHNGKEFKHVVITIDKVGHRLGDFAHTTSRVLHAGPGIGATRGSKFVAVK